MDEKKTVRLKSRFGPRDVMIHNRKDIMGGAAWGYKKQVVHFNFDNDFKADVPVEWWEQIQNAPLADGRTYRESFFPI